MLALSTMMMQSCLKDQEEIFDEPSSTRLQAALDNAKEVLTSSENGWVFDYFPDRYLSYGGFLYTVKFDASKVTVGCELDPGNFETSYYRLTDDNGPTLSFDTYNSLMHFFATPSSGNYEAYDGDFEFMIMEVTDDLITLMGKRTSNIMYMRRLNEDAATLIEGAAEMSNNFFLSSADGTIGSTQVSADFDQNVRYVEFSWGEGEGNTAGEYFLPTPTGIRMLHPVEVNGSTITELSFNPNTLTYTGSDTAGNPITLSGVLPATYSFIDEFSGEFTFTYGNGASVDVTLVPDATNQTVTIEGISPGFDLIASYDRISGSINVCGQTVYSDSQRTVMVLTMIPSGNFYPSNNYGFSFTKNPAKPGVFQVSTYGSTPAEAMGFIIVMQIPGNSSYYASSAPWLINGAFQIPYINALIKK